MAFKSIIAASCLFLLSACGAKVSTDAGGVSVEDNQTSSSYTYSYEVNGCKTGEHSFGSASDYCNGLMNEQLNNGCAKQMRQATFDRECK